MEDQTHINASLLDDEPFETGFEAGPIYSFYCEDSYADVRPGITIVVGRVGRESALRPHVFPTMAELDGAKVLDPQRVVLPLATIAMKNDCRYWIDSIAELFVYQTSSQLHSLVEPAARTSSRRSASCRSSARRRSLRSAHSGLRARPSWERYLPGEGDYVRSCLAH